MENEGRLYAQVAAEAGVTTERAMVACYLLNLSKEGKSLDQAAALLRKDRSEARDVARDWAIPFTDYDTSQRALALTWRKEKRGRWLLEVGDHPIAEAVSDGKGGYRARRVDHNGSPIGVTETGSKDATAIRRLSVALERASLSIFGVDEVRIIHDDQTVAPKLAADPAKLRAALAAA